MHATSHNHFKLYHIEYPEKSTVFEDKQPSARMSPKKIMIWGDALACHEIHGAFKLGWPRWTWKHWITCTTNISTSQWMRRQLLARPQLGLLRLLAELIWHAVAVRRLMGLTLTKVHQILILLSWVVGHGAQSTPVPTCAALHSRLCRSYTWISFTKKTHL